MEKFSKRVPSVKFLRLMGWITGDPKTKLFAGFSLKILTQLYCGKLDLNISCSNNWSRSSWASRELTRIELISGDRHRKLSLSEWKWDDLITSEDCSPWNLEIKNVISNCYKLACTEHSVMSHKSLSPCWS